MTRRPNMTEEHKAIIREMREAGASGAAIAARVGYSVGSVRWFCLMEGIEPPRPERHPAVVGQVLVGRCGRVVRRFTPEEDRRLLRMRLEQRSLSEIGRALGRRHHSVLGRLATLARYDALAEGEGV